MTQATEQPHNLTQKDIDRRWVEAAQTLLQDGAPLADTLMPVPLYPGRFLGSRQLIGEQDPRVYQHLA